MDRGVFLVLLCVASAFGSVEWDADGRPVVTLKQSRVLGKQGMQMGVKYTSFTRIPYAKPPVGQLRFMDPEPAELWEGTRDSEDPTPVCPQPEMISFLSGKFEIEGQEDCLYLDIHVPVAAEDKWASLPVMVWIHGGGFTSGAAIHYDNVTLITRGVIVVNINYRLGILGFFSTGDDLIPGNYGLKDQTMALRWLQENIANFGGDPTRVTIFGESAGGASVHFQTLAPSAFGLFSGAIIQSGTAFAQWAMGANFKKDTIKLGQMLECPDTENTAAIVDCVRGTEAGTLVQMFYALSAGDGMYGPTFGPRVDGTYLPAHPAILTRVGAHAHVPTMIGTTKDDGSFMSLALFILSPNATRFINEDFDTNAPKALALVEEDNGASIARQIFEYYTDDTTIDMKYIEQYHEMFDHTSFSMGTDIVAEHLSSRVPVFLYSLDHRGVISFSDLFKKMLEESETKIDMSKKVCHGDDIQYLFNIELLFDERKLSEEDLRLREIMLDMWSDFAITGNPTPDGHLGFTWAPVSKDNLHHLSISLPPKMASDSRSEARAFWASLPLKHNQYSGSTIDYSKAIPEGSQSTFVGHDEL